MQAIAEAPLAVQIHLATVIPAFILGTWLIFFSRKGGPGHRALGAVYLALMTITAIAAYFVRSINSGHLSPIHLFVPLTLFGVAGALIAARRRDIKGHRNAMVGVYVGGLLIAGGFAFAPGRLLHSIFFG